MSDTRKLFDVTITKKLYVLAETQDEAFYLAEDNEEDYAVTSNEGFEVSLPNEFSTEELQQVPVRAELGYGQSLGEWLKARGHIK